MTEPGAATEETTDTRPDTEPDVTVETATDDARDVAGTAPEPTPPIGPTSNVAPTVDADPEPTAEAEATNEAEATAEAGAAPEAEATLEAETTPEAEAGGAEPTAADTPVANPAPAPPTAVPPRPRREQAPAGPTAEATELLHGAVTFGRVDADGTVYVRTGAGDRAVGQFPDTAPHEALVYYVRKYEELVGQVDLFTQRLRAGSMSLKDARSGLGKLQEATAEPAAVGDVDGLQRWVTQLASDLDRRSREADQRRAAAKARAATEREALVAEAEKIAATPPDEIHFKTAMERVRTLIEDWKAHQKAGPRLDKPVEDKLWQRLSAARATVDRARRQHINAMTEQRSAIRSAKEKIITEAEALSTSTDWRTTGDAYRRLMERWKSAGRLARAEDDALWARFRAAQDAFHSARSTVLSAQDEEFRGNLVIKEQLLTEAEALLPVTDVASAKRRLRDIQERWDAAGKVPRSDLDRVERRLTKVLDAVRDADQSRWTKTNPEALARARGVVDQLESSVAALQADLDKAEKAGDARGADRARTALDTRQAWLDQARKALKDLGG